MTEHLDSNVDPEVVEEVADAVARARGIMVLTGAGVSAESGIPTFREPGSLWDRYDPTEIATPEAFARDPRKVWEWYDLRRRAVVRCHPNPGHEAIARLLCARADATLVTQNVDGLHQRALSAVCGGTDGGSETGPVLELHGSLLRLRCSRCGARREHHDPIDTQQAATLPACDSCGELLRPDVVWFGEPLDSRVLDTAFEASRNAELCLVVGTSAVVHPAASVPLATLESGGDLVEVNPEATPLSAMARWSLRGSSGTVLPAILKH